VIREIFAVNLLLLALALATSPTPASAPPVFHDFSFTPCEGLICFPIRMPDSSERTFVLDTGNVHSTLAADTAAATKITAHAAHGQDGQPIAGIEQTDNVSLQIGELALQTKLLVFDRKDMGPMPHPFDGTLAFTDLKDRIVVVDFPNHRLRISDPLTGPAQPRPGTLKTITFGKQGPPILTGGPFSIDGHAVHAQIDTCFTGSMVVYDAAISSLGLGPLAQSATASRTFPYTDGGVQMHEAKAKALGFTGRSLPSASPRVYFPAAGVHQPDGLFEATVGTELFTGSVLTLDLHSMSFDIS
jgi:hypothetical protein